MGRIAVIAPYTSLPGEAGFNRFRYLTEGLAGRDHSVTLVTSAFRHLDKEHRSEPAIGDSRYQVALIPEPGYRRNIGWGRIRSHRKFARNLSVFLASTAHEVDLVYAACPTLVSAKQAQVFAARQQIPFVLDVQDIWPEAITPFLPIPPRLSMLLLAAMTREANRLYGAADALIAVSKCYLARASSVNSRAAFREWVYIGADMKLIADAEPAPKRPEEVWATYIGTLSHSYDLLSVLKAVRLLGERLNRFRLKIIGGGPDEDALRHAARRLGVDHVVDFLGVLPYEDLVRYLKASDFAMNAVASKSLGSVTNKLSDYVAAGLPVVSGASSQEVVDLLESRRIGGTYRDETTCAALMMRLIDSPQTRTEMRVAALATAAELFDRPTTYSRIYDVIEALLR